LAGSFAASDGKPLEFYSYGGDDEEKRGGRPASGARINSLVPSPYWSEFAAAQFRIGNRRAFPPRADHANCQMRACRHGSHRCNGRIYPAPYIAVGENRFGDFHQICADCVNESILRSEQASQRWEGERFDEYGARQENEAADISQASSPTTLTLHELENRNERLKQIRLASERESDLLREIARHEQTTRVELKGDSRTGMGQRDSYLGEVSQRIAS